AGVRGVPEDRGPMGPSPALPDLRQGGLLRFLAKQARDQTFPPGASPDSPVYRARRELGLVLCGRGDAGARVSELALAWAVRRPPGPNIRWLSIPACAKIEGVS